MCSMFLIALGVNIEVRAGVLMLAIDGLVLAISKTFKIEFGKVKVASDCTQVAIAVIASLLLTSMKSKLRPDEEHRQNSPWNIAADFDIDMSFSKEDIARMLRQYEDDYHTGMDIERLSGLLYEYTSGYPFLVSRICKLMDEKIAGNSHISDKSRAWTDDGFYEAEKMVVKEDNTLYQSLLGKLKIYPQLRIILSDLLFRGRSIPYVATADYIRDAAMFGFIKNENHMVIISNRIFEAVLYEYFTFTACPAA